MYYLNSKLSEIELDYLESIGLSSCDEIEILRIFKNECYIQLQANIEIDPQNDRYDKKQIFPFSICFGDYEDPYNNVNYEYYQCKPKHIIRFFSYYLVESYDFPGEWYRASAERNGSLLLEVYDDTLEEAILNL